MERTNHMDVTHIVSLVTKKHPAISAEDAGQFIQEWLTLIRDTLLRQEGVESHPFGIFECLAAGDDEPGQPANDNGEVESFRIHFTPSDSLQKSVNSFFAHFEPSLLNEGVMFDELATVNIGEEKLDDLSENLVMRALPAPVLLTEVPVVESEPEISGETSILDAVNQEQMIPEPEISESVTAEPPTPVERESNPPPESSLRRPPTHKSGKRSSIWIPIIGGVAIVIAGLFFFHHPRTNK
ncbi:MAG: hypothetical protein PHY68_03330 [Proteiniphilum sp.]|nr:hypothetical protein [Proteiniphilum sp.]MDD5619473.1 hypothetical protein [Proteiniphilum sp.]